MSSNVPMRLKMDPGVSPLVFRGRVSRTSLAVFFGVLPRGFALEGAVDRNLVSRSSQSNTGEEGGVSGRLISRDYRSNRGRDQNATSGLATTCRVCYPSQISLRVCDAMGRGFWNLPNLLLRPFEVISDLVSVAHTLLEALSRLRQASLCLLLQLQELAVLGIQLSGTARSVSTHSRGK